MTVDQPSLFDAPATRGASRNSDPQTSRDAARSMEGHVLRAQQWLVLTTLKAVARPYNGECASAYDVVERLAALHIRGLSKPAPQQNVVARRLTELVELGMLRETDITRPGSSGRHCRCYALTDAGREYLRDRSAA